MAPPHSRNDQMAVYRALHQWRDRVAREEDESLGYVLPNHMLFILADRMPTEVPQLLACCQPTPPLVRMSSAELAFLIQNVQSESQLRMSEMKRLAQETVDAEEKKRKREGIHVRFEVEEDSDDDSDTEHMPSQRPCPDVLDNEDLVTEISNLMVPSSTLFGPNFIDFDDGNSTQSTDAGLTKANTILQSLALVVATPKEILTAARQPGALLDLPAEHEFVPASKRKIQRKSEMETIVISKTYGKHKPVNPSLLPTEEIKDASAMDIDPTEGFEPLHSNATSDKDEVYNDDDDQITTAPSSKRQKSTKKKNSKKSKRKGGADGTPTSAAKAIDPESIESFDYSKTQDEALIPERQNSHKKSSKKRSKANTDHTFDPYSRPEISKDLSRKAHKPKSSAGGRSIAFKK